MCFPPSLFHPTNERFMYGVVIVVQHIEEQMINVVTGLLQSDHAQNRKVIRN